MLTLRMDLFNKIICLLLACNKHSHIGISGTEVKGTIPTVTDGVVDFTQAVKQDHKNTSESEAEACVSKKNALTTKDTLGNVDLGDENKRGKAVILKCFILLDTCIFKSGLFAVAFHCIVFWEKMTSFCGFLILTNFCLGFILLFF